MIRMEMKKIREKEERQGKGKELLSPFSIRGE